MEENTDSQSKFNNTIEVPSQGGNSRPLTGEKMRDSELVCIPCSSFKWSRLAWDRRLMSSPLKGNQNTAPAICPRGLQVLMRISLLHTHRHTRHSNTTRQCVSI